MMEPERPTPNFPPTWESKPAFRDAFQRRRCLVPVDNFYEWKKTEAGKQPYAIALAGAGRAVGELAVAGR
jgi:putative SOS response-associated peptidase YedK